MHKLVFCSDALPRALSDAERFTRWREFVASVSGSAHLSYRDDQPFSQRMEAMQLGGIGIVHFSGTVDRITRNARNVAASPSNGYLFGLNRGAAALSLTQFGRATTLDTQAAALSNSAEPGEIAAAGRNAYSVVAIPAQRLTALIRDADDLVARPIDGGTPAMRFLRRYVDIVSTTDLANDPALHTNIATTLVDLVALALGAGRDAAELAQTRGLRAAHLAAILREIHGGFRDPAFSPNVVAARLRMSPRYLRDLLHESGASFTDRVMELRLQEGRSMLAQPRFDRLKVIDIALSCGFNEVSYFNRCFRRRFGETPTAFRAGGHG